MMLYGTTPRRMPRPFKLTADIATSVLHPPRIMLFPASWMLETVEKR